jgi:ComF family protein
LPQKLLTVPHAFFSLLFPDECRICNRTLSGYSRLPVCQECLRSPQPFLAEHFCISCGTPFLNSHPLDEEGRCALCRTGALGFDAAYCYGVYDGALRKLIHLFKYSRMRALDKPLGAYLALALPRGKQFDAVVPVPLHWRRRWARGFNQSELLARAIARRCSVPVLRALQRRRATAFQAGLTNAARRENVAQAFEARRRCPVAGKRILLVDDVMTTGATAAACARALRRAGAESVSLLALVRVDRRWTPVPHSAAPRESRR